MSVLVLPQKVRQEIELTGMNAYPNECCGILLGREEAGAQMTRRMVDRVIQVRNNFETGEQYHRFAIDSRSLMLVEREAASNRQLVLGFYHSHPDHPARPSEFDREHAWEYYSYVIVSIRNKLATEMTSWVLTGPGGSFRAQDIFRH